MPIAKRISLSEDLMPNVVKVLNLILLATKSKKKNCKLFRDEYSDIAAEICQPQRARTIAKQCVGLTNNALGSHRYYEAAKLLWILCQDRTIFDMFIFRASMLVLENLDISDRDGVMWSFFNEVQNLGEVNKKEVQLEFLIHGLTRDNQELEGKLNALANLKRKKYLRKNPLLDPIYEGYRVYLDCIKLCDSLSTDPELVNPQIVRDAEETILKMNSLIDVPGDWDIFVLKLVELLNKYELVKPPKDSDTQKESDEKEVDVETVLSKYVEKNPDNLNAHIYLSLYLNDRNPTLPKLIHHLEIISKMSPSDERVLILLQKLEKLSKKLKKCFMFLDYPSNGKNQNAWNMLLEFLCDAKRRNHKKALHTIQTCWISRRKSWYWLHFNPCQVSRLKEAELVLVLKVKVLLHLDKDHKFIEKLFEKFPTLEELLTEKNDGNDIDESEYMVF